MGKQRTSSDFRHGNRKSRRSNAERLVRIQTSLASLSNFFSHGSEDSFVSDTEKVFMYSMAIVRMLNGLIAPFHGQTAAPMSM